MKPVKINGYNNAFYISFEVADWKSFSLYHSWLKKVQKESISLFEKLKGKNKKQ